MYVIKNNIVTCTMADSCTYSKASLNYGYQQKLNGEQIIILSISETTRKILSMNYIKSKFRNFYYIMETKK